MLPSNWQFGFGCLPTAPPNFPSESGIYLATSPEIAFGFLSENYIRSGKPGSNPSAEIDEFVVIVVDDSRVTGSIRVDPQIPSTDAKCFLYEGVIDVRGMRSEEHTSELQSLMRISYAVFCLKKTIQQTITHQR